MRLAMKAWRVCGWPAILTTLACTRIADPKPAPAPASAVASSAPAPASAAPRVSFGDLGKMPAHASTSNASTYREPPDISDNPGSPLLLPAAEALRKADWARARQLLAEAAGKLDRVKSFSSWLVAHALWGRACAASGDQACAEREYESVRGAWTDPDAASQQARGDGDAQEVRLEQALLSVEEAHFFFAEKKRKETVDPLTMPQYKGTGTRQDVIVFIAKNVTPWVRKREQAIFDAEKEYQKIALMKPKPSAIWLIEAASADGMMWAKFKAEFVQAPMPEAWKQNGPMDESSGMTWADMREFWAKCLDVAAGPINKRMRQSFEACKDYADRARIRNAASKVCTEWLEKNPAPAEP
jgi:hypothetical protein